MKPVSPSRRMSASSSVPASSRRGQKRFRAGLENLEDRKVLSTLLDPTAFTSLGAFSTTASDSYTLDTNALTLTGPGVSVTGVLSANNIAVFDFDSVSIAAGSTITATGSNPLAILSRGTFTVDGTIAANGGTPAAGSEAAVAGGPGGYGGGQFTTTQGAGLGPGGGGAVSGGVAGTYYGGGGGGFGGAGGQGGASGGLGGLIYGNLLTQLQGGSGGASGTTPTGMSLATTGGGGGGAVELVAVTSITVDSGGIIQANGGSGGIAGSGSSGGGSGGGILMKAPTVTNNGTVSADGGVGPSGGCCGGGGGGGGGILDVLYSQSETGTGSFEAYGGPGGSSGSSGSGTAGQAGSTGIVSIQQTYNITASLSGTEIVLTGDNTVSSLGVTYDPTSETYTFTANSGETFGTDGSLPAGVTFSPIGNTATLAPNGTTWTALGDSVGTSMTNSAGTAITLGGALAPASNFGTAFDVANSGGGVTGLTIDDSAQATSDSPTITATGLSATTGASITYGSASLSGFTFDAGSSAEQVTVQGTPAVSGATPMTLNMGGKSGNNVFIGDSSHSVASFGDITVTGTTGLTINDSNNNSPATATVSSTNVSYSTGSSPIFDYSAAQIDGFTFDGGNTALTLTITGSPAATSGLSHIAVNPGNVAGNSITLGDSSNAASTLGGINVAGPTSLTIDDSIDSTPNQTVTFDSGQLTIGAATTVTYSGTIFSAMTFDAGTGGTAVKIHRTPTGLGATALELDMGAATNNTVQVGSSDADLVGNVTMTTSGSGTIGLTVDDSNGNGSFTIGMTATTISFGGGGTFDYSGATLASLTLYTDNSGGNTVSVTSTPALTPAGAILISTFSGSGDEYDLGDPTHAASGLGSIDIATSGDSTAILKIDDSNGASGQSVAVTSSSVSFTGGPTFGYAGHSFGGITLDSSNLGGTTIAVASTPTLSGSLTLAMGNTGANTISLGDSMDPASGLADVAIKTSGSTAGLTVDDSASAGSDSVTIGSGSLSLGSSPLPTFTYTGVTLTGLTFKAPGGGSNAVAVQGAFTGAGPGTNLTLAMGSGTGNAVILGGALTAASSLGGVMVTGSTDLTIDDTVDETYQAINVSTDSVNFGGSSPIIDLSNATLGGLTIDAPSIGETAIAVIGSPAASSGLAPVTINVGTAAGVRLGLGDATHAASSLGDVTVTTSGTAPSNGSVALTVDDSADASGQTVTLGATALGFQGGSTFTYGGADLAGLTFDAGGAGGNAITMTGSPQLVAFTTDISVSAPSINPDTVSIGDAANPFSTLAGDVGIQGAGAVSLTIDDSGSTAVTSYILNNEFSAGAVPVVFFSRATGLTGMTVKGGSGGDSWDVTGTPAGVTTLIDTAPASGHTDVVSLGGATAGTADSLAGVTVDGGGVGTTNLVVNDVNDTTSRTPTLEYNSTAGLSDLTGIAASTLAFNSGVSQVSLMPSSITGVTTALTVDFSQGNPLPVGSTTSFHFEGVLGSSNTLILQGELPSATPFDSEIYTPLANAPGSGTIAFTQGGNSSILDFGGLTPINDTVPAASYWFAAPSSAGVVDLANGPTIGTATTDTISSGDTPSAFELVNFANKANVVVDLTAMASPTYLSPPSVAATGLVSLTLDYFGSGTTGKTLTVSGTTAGIVNTIQIGGSGNTVDVQNVTAGGPLSIVSQPDSPGAANNVSIGNAGSLAGILADVTIDGPAQSVNLTVDGSAAMTPYGAMLLQHVAASPMAELSGLSPGASIVYDPSAIGTFALSTGTGADNLTVDFVNGNPLAGPGTPAVGFPLQYNAGGGGDSLTFQDSSGSTAPIFDSENYLSTGPNSGNVSFFASGSSGTPVFQGGVQFSQLTPTVDSTPVTNYTFTAPRTGGGIAVTDAASPGYALIADPSPSPTFESVAYTNKTNVVIDATPVSRNNFVLLNNSTAATGQTTLAVDLGSGNDTLVVSANPAGVSTAIDGGAGSQAITVNGAGLAAGTTSSNFTIFGGAGPDVMRLNSQGTGSPAALTPGTPSGPATATFGTGPGATSLAFLNIGTIQDYTTNHAPTLGIPSPPPTIFAQPGVPLVNIPVAIFMDSDLVENPSSYVATINWGDGLAPTTGTITADPSTPGRYIISGSHTYQAAGSNLIAVTLTDLGGSFTSTLNNAGGAVVPVTTQLDQVAPVSGVTASVNVVDLQLGSTTAFAATAGTSASGELAVFTNPNGPTNPGAYSALINWGDGTALGGATIAADPNVSGAFDISGTHNYAAPGTYSGTIELHAVGTGQSMMIPLSATAQAPSVSVTAGIKGSNEDPLGPLKVATVSVPFFRGSPGLDASSYSASVDYGDGSPTVPATLAPASIPGASAFSVNTSGHYYSIPGTYTLTVAIRDAQGVVVGSGSAPVEIKDPPPVNPTAPMITWGRLSPQSDSGMSNSDGITNVTTPTFVGGATPGAVIVVYATPTGSTAAPVPIASGVANDAGAWSATVVGSPLAQGSYQVSATATNAGGTASFGLGTVAIDTTAPVITDIVFNRLRGELDVYFQDNLGGMSLPALSNGASYQISAKPLNNTISVRKTIVPTSVTVIDGATPTSVDEAVVVFNRGKVLNPGHYTVQVLASGIFDVAGNTLAGRFYGSYPTGNGAPGTNYVAQFTAYPARTLAAYPFSAGYARPKMPTSGSTTPKVRVAEAAVARSQVRALARQAGAWSDHAKHDPASLIDRAIASLDAVLPKRRR